MSKIALLKIGTNSVVNGKGQIRRKLLDEIARDVKIAMADGWCVAVVSSGAVACGQNDPSMRGVQTTEQVYSMVGQRRLMNHWAKAFAKVGLTIGQGLYTNRQLESLPDRKKIIKDGLIECFRCGVVPVINENDAAVLDELVEVRDEGDNDHLTALVGILIEADVLVFLTTVAGVIDPDGDQLIEKIDARDKEILGRLKSWPNQRKGGMLKKVTWGQNFVQTTGGTAVIKKYNAMFALSRALRGMKEGTIIEMA